jgi:hypothetical protein
MIYVIAGPDPCYNSYNITALDLHTPFVVLFKLILNKNFESLKSTLQMTKRSTKQIVIQATAALMLFASCKKTPVQPEPEPEPQPITPTYTVPATYAFANVDYSGQTARLDMVAELKTYMNTGNTIGTVLSAQKMKDMYANANSPFANAALNTSGKDIKSKVFLADQSLFETYFANLAAASQSTVSGGAGVAGVLVSTTDPSKKYLCDANGVEWTQVIEKGLMGSLMYYQTTAIYLDLSKTGDAVNNTDVVAGQGTAMEHHWDEAFGYFGAPLSFPTVTTGVRFWGKYCNDRNAVIGSNAIMNAFIKGRAAISNKDYATRDQQREVIRSSWEKVIVATMISYINSTKLKITDDAIRNHNLSELKGFLMNLKCNPSKKISNTQIAKIESLLGNDFYNITIAALDEMKAELSTLHGLDSVKNSL